MTYEDAVSSQKALESQFPVVLFSLSLTLVRRKSAPVVRIFRHLAKPITQELMLPDRLRIARSQIGQVVKNETGESPYTLAYSFQAEIPETIIRMRDVLSQELVARKALAPDSRQQFWQNQIDLLATPLMVLYGHSDNPFPL